MACGFLTQALMGVKRLAWLGPIKSVLGLFSALYAYKPYDLAIEYRPTDVQISRTECCCNISCGYCEECEKTHANSPRNRALASKGNY